MSSRIRCGLFVGACLLISAICSACHGVEATWIGGASGPWSDAANWSTGVVPTGSLTDVLVDGDAVQASAVTLDQNATVGNLVVDVDDRLEFEQFRQLTAANVRLAGEMELSPAAALSLSKSLWIEPTGQLHLIYAEPVTTTKVQGVAGSSALVSLLNQGTISGAGQVGTGLHWANEGTIVANQAGEDLNMLLNSPLQTNYNSGALLAENGGTLVVRPTSSNVWLYNSQGTDSGLIEARGDSTVFISSITLAGGEIGTSAEGGNAEGTVLLANVTLNSVTLDGQIEVSRVTLRNEIVNNGTVRTASSEPIVSILSPTVLRGSGRLDLRRGSLGGVGGGGSTIDSVLINEAGHTITGAGYIGADGFHFYNRGLVETSVVESDAETTIRFGNFTEPLRNPVNTGVVQVAAGTILRFSSGSGSYPTWINSSGGTDGVIEVAANGTFYPDRTAIQGGILRAMPLEDGDTGLPGRVINNFGTRTILRDLRLEGSIGDAVSSWQLEGEVENTTKLRAGEIAVNGDVLLTGGGEVMLGDDDRAGNVFAVTSPGNARTLQNKDNRIVGSGRIELNGYSLINESLIEADVMERSLQVSILGGTGNSEFVNAGTLRASDGATLAVVGLVTNQFGDRLGVIEALDGSEAQLSWVTGGVLRSEGSGVIRIAGGGQLQDVRNEGQLELLTNTLVRGVLENDGEIARGNTSGRLSFYGPVARLEGAGTFTAGDLGVELYVGDSNSTQFFHGADHTIEGRGEIRVINGSFINDGTVRATEPGPLVMRIDPGNSLEQRGTLAADFGSLLQVYTSSERLTNRGILDVDGQITLQNQTGNALELRNSSGAEIQLEDHLRVVSTSSPGNVNSLWNQEGALVSGRGLITLEEPGFTTQGVLRNSGTIRPLGTMATPGQLRLSGDFIQESTGVLDFDLSGNSNTSWFDTLLVEQGDAQLDGTLAVSLADGFVPEVGDSYTLLETEMGTIAGEFSDFLAPAVPGQWWQLDYQPNSVVLNVVGLTADFDQDGDVDAADLDVWRQSYATDAGADADADGDTDGADYLAWQRQFGKGLAAPLAIAVPEPLSGYIALVSFGLATCLVRLRSLGMGDSLSGSRVAGHRATSARGRS